MAAADDQRSGQNRLKVSTQFIQAIGRYAVHIEVVASVPPVGIGQVVPFAGSGHLLLAQGHAALLGEIVLVAAVPPIHAHAGQMVIADGAVGEQAGGHFRIEHIQLDPDRHGAGGVAFRQAGIVREDALLVGIEAKGSAPRALRHPGRPMNLARPVAARIIPDRRAIVLVERVVGEQACIRQRGLRLGRQRRSAGQQRHPKATSGNPVSHGDPFQNR